MTLKMKVVNSCALFLLATTLTLQAPRAAEASIEIAASTGGAGEVSDGDGDGFGDNSELAALLSAGVDRNSTRVPGTVRTQFEWDISTLTLADVGSAKVVLTTLRGTLDELDTQFFAGQADQDGVVAAGDFQAPAALIPGAVMPVTGDIFDYGTFEFDVTGFLEDSLLAGHTYFSVQGRVDESLAGTGSARGLQVFSALPTVPGAGGAFPMLVVSEASDGPEAAIPEPFSLAVWGGLASLVGCCAGRRQRA